MFKAVCDAKDFKKIINATSNLVDEICFEVDEEGIRASAMDPSHVALVSLNIPKTVFSEYMSGIHDLGIDLEALKKIMARSKSNDKIIIEFDEEKNKLLTTFKNNVTRNFSMALYDISSNNLKVPDIEYPNKVSIKAGAFVEALKDSELVNDHIILSVNSSDNQFVISSKGDLNYSETIFSLSKSETEVVNTEESENNGNEEVINNVMVDYKVLENSKSTFNLAYLKDITKSTASDDVLDIYLGEDMPVKVEYNIGGAKLVFLLAPRIES
ncbi:DNA polymerase sliding clamp [Methanococcus voltae]|uniref:DNA polymerase sliding clamp n=1 Tax=Methanococcus voltae (strain ATCC BAA-1334 / A3) TaxID=456320 RepID=D7DV12_METV3|nr:DNA polymerase sliding clamp [Methanococcus voltae]MCS3900777.1 proliferating cell nuclear antigen [Methanococcus voltae]